MKNKARSNLNPATSSPINDSLKKELSEQLELILDGMLDGVTYQDTNGKVIYFNKRALEILHMTKEQLTGVTTADPNWKAIYEDGKPYPPERFPSNRVLATAKPQLNHIMGIHYGKHQDDNKYAWITINSHPTFDGAGKLNGTITTFSDSTPLINAKRKAEEAEKKALLGQIQLKETLSMARLGGWELDVSKGVFLFNDSFYKIFRSSVDQEGGYEMTAEEYARRFVHPDERDVVELEIEKAIRTTDPDFSRNLEHRIIYDDGEVGHVSVTYFIIKDQDGNTTKLYGFLQDITQNKEAEKELFEAKLTAEDSEKKLLQAQRLSHIGSWEYFFETDTVTWSEELFRIFDRPLELGAPPYSKQRPFYTPESFERMDRAVDACANHEVPYEIGLDIIRPDGSIRHIISKGDVIKEAGGKIIGCYGTAQDVTDRKKSEDEIRRLSLIARKTINGALITDPDLKILWVNKSFTRITGYEPEEAIGKKPAELLQGIGTSKQTRTSVRKKINAREPFESIILNYRKDGTPYWNKLQGQPLYDEQNQLEGFFAVQTDISKEIYQQELIKSIRLKLEFALETANIGIYDWGITTSKVDIYGSYFKVIGHEAEQFQPDPYFARIAHPLDLDTLQEKVDSIVDHSHQELSIDFRVKDSDGQIRWIRNQGQIFNTENGAHLIGLIQNVSSQYRQEEDVLKATIMGQEKERSRISSDIHDGIQQVFLSSLLTLRYCYDNLKSDKHLDSKILEKLDNGIKLLNIGLEETRSIAHALMPSRLSNDISELIDSLVSNLNADFTVEVIDYLEHIDLDDETTLTLYRIVQESFNNIIKYAQATRVTIKMNNDYSYMHLSIEDDGVGIKTPDLKSKFGLLSMTNRAKSLGGQLEIHSPDGKGTTIVVRIPLSS